MFYYYISLSNDMICHHCAIHQSELHRSYTLLEWTREAEPREIDHCKLVYCGHGHWKDEHVQENITKYI